MLRNLRAGIRRSPALRSFVGHPLAGSGLFDWYFRGYRPSGHWRERLAQAEACPDNASIPRVTGAGSIGTGTQLMHNGLRVVVGSYYGPETAVMLRRNRGVHEPQEERVFQMVLPEMPVGATMLELGCFWAFYSLWFKSAVTDARCLLVEAEAFNLMSGQNNFKLNGYEGEWLHALVGAEPDPKSAPPVLTVDQIVRDKGVARLDLLHSDIQGHELEMLDGAVESLSSGRVRYAFISTHSNDLHHQCEANLASLGFTILASIDLDDTYSEDGLIVARHSSFDGMGPVALSRRGGRLFAG